ncbi:MAG: phosphoglycerate dehydrogenase, partial [Armatimonadetes bacterium]|nr:phosphoglycerate dehydrogenase [Armatimonadota bacterium]
MRRVLVTARVFLKDEQAVEQLKRAGFQVVEAAFAGRPSEDELISALQGFDAVIAGTEAYTERVLRSLPKLRAIARWGVGVDAIDVAAATRAGVAVLNTPGPIAESVADLTFALMLGIARRICEGDARVRAGKWGPVEGTLVWGKVLGIVGVGAIGTAVARRARGFNMTVLGYDPSPRPEAAELGVEFVHLDTLLRRADFVTLHAPLTPETRNMIGRRELSLMKPTAYLINCARGGLVDQEALTEALRNGTIGGAA